MVTKIALYLCTMADADALAYCHGYYMSTNKQPQVYSIILVIMNMGCRSIMCMIGYCHCQFVREGGGKTGWATGGPVFDAPTLGVAEGW